MTWIKKKLYLIGIPISLGLSIFSTVSVRANSLTELVGMEKVHTWKISQTFKTPNRGTPPATAGGATRGSCAQKAKGLIPLIPKEKLGLTLKERPTFFWHISESDAKTAEFLLLDDNDDVIYETNLNIPKEQGIFAFTLPEEAPGLKINKRYNWYLSVSCSSNESDETMTVAGWVERTKPNLAMRMKLNKFEPKYRSKIYTEAGIWHEAIASVAAQRCSSPDDSNIMTNWNKLLTSVGLSKVASEPLNNICNVKN
ncbi:MAG: DUF928 domain-containing protein [Cyanobacteria bacterium P01_A01_bin.84]